MFINSESIWIKSNLKFVQILTKMCQIWEGKNPERFYCRFYIKFNWAEGASGHRSVFPSCRQDQWYLNHFLCSDHSPPPFKAEILYYFCCLKIIIAFFHCFEQTSCYSRPCCKSLVTSCWSLCRLPLDLYTGNWTTSKYCIHMYQWSTLLLAFYLFEEL